MTIMVEKQEENPIPAGNHCCTEATGGKRPLVLGILTAFAAIGFYLGLITAISDWYNAKAQFNDYRWWVITLALGLGLQVGLFTHMRRMTATAHLKGAASGMAASGGVSGVAMALCCSHYLASLLPIVGLPFLSAAMAGLEVYQTQFFFVGVISNLLGVAYMIWLMSRKGLLPRLPKIRQHQTKVHNH